MWLCWKTAQHAHTLTERNEFSRSVFHKSERPAGGKWFSRGRRAGSASVFFSFCCFSVWMMKSVRPHYHIWSGPQRQENEKGIFVFALLETATCPINTKATHTHTLTHSHTPVCVRATKHFSRWQLINARSCFLWKNNNCSPFLTWNRKRSLILLTKQPPCDIKCLNRNVTVSLCAAHKSRVFHLR